MNCPICITRKLQPTQLDDTLSSSSCPQCDGRWIAAERYWRWLQTKPAISAVGTASSAGDVVVKVTDNRRAKLCPGCGRLMTRAKVGRGATFEIDRCGGCGGTWLDAREWEALRSLGLHDDIHFIFSAAWQADVARQERERMRDQMMMTKLGPQDWAEVQRVRAWLLAHPHRDELSAYLLDGLHKAAPRRTTLTD